MNIKMTPRQALQVQAKQLDYYEPMYPSLREAAKEATCTDGLNMDQEYDMVTINEAIPRGGFLGALIGQEF